MPLDPAALTVDTMITSFSRPWKASTVLISTSSFQLRPRLSCAMGGGTEERRQRGRGEGGGGCGREGSQRLKIRQAWDVKDVNTTTDYGTHSSFLPPTGSHA